jgi:hypothetical protein
VVRTLRVVRTLTTTSERLSVLSAVGLIVVAATLVAGTTACLYWMVPVMGIMLTNAAANAWDLMLGLAKYTARRARGEGPVGVEASG